jgi:hypothetical protein
MVILEISPAPSERDMKNTTVITASALGVCALGGLITTSQLTSAVVWTIVAGTAVLRFIEAAYDVETARLDKKKKEIELEVVKNGRRKTETVRLSIQMATAIEEKGYFIIKKPDGTEQQVQVKVD